MLPSVPSPLLALRHGVVIEANAAALAILGVADTSVLGRELLDLVDEADLPAAEALLGRADPTRSTVARLHVGGAHRVVELRAAPDPTPDSAPGSTVVTLVDRSEEHLLHALVDAVADSTLLLDSAGLIRWQSRALGARQPADSELGIGANPLERVHPEDLPGVLEAAAEGLAAPGNRVRRVARALTPEGDDTWQLIEMSGVNGMDHPDLEGFVVQVRLMDDAEEIESLAATDGQFLSLAEGAPMGIVVCDLMGRTIYRNATAKELLGQPELRPEQDWRDLARADRRAQLHAVIHDAAERSATVQMTVPFEVGELTRWLRVHVVPRRTVDAANPYLIATLEDVSAEIEAREATDRLTHMLDATSDYVAVFRPTGEILYVNAATRALLDVLALEGAVGELRDLIDDDPRRAWIESALSVLETTDVWQGNLELNAGQGRTIPVSAMGLIRRTPDGELDWIAIHARDISELKEAENRLRELASHDHLTGLANRARFNERLELAVARHRRERSGLAVLFCDLDGFKEINDSHGHAAGDVVLTAIADRLRLVTRAADTTARVGGDEFVIVCEGVTDDEGLLLLARRVIDAVSGPITLPEVARTAQPPERIRVGISIGIGVADSDLPEVDPDRLLTLADTAMYAAKAGGGNRAVVARLE